MILIGNINWGSNLSAPLTAIITLFAILISSYVIVNILFKVEDWNVTSLFFSIICILASIMIPHISEFVLPIGLLVFAIIVYRLLNTKEVVNE